MRHKQEMLAVETVIQSVLSHASAAATTHQLSLDPPGVFTVTHHRRSSPDSSTQSAGLLPLFWCPPITLQVKLSSDDFYITYTTKQISISLNLDKREDMRPDVVAEQRTNGRTK